MRLLVSLLLLLLAGCSNFSEVVLVVDGDLRTPDEIDQIRVTVEDESGAALETMARIGDIRGQFPKTVSIIHDPNTRLGPTIVNVIGLKDGEEILRSVARFSFEQDQSKQLRVVLSRRCLGVMSCGGETTCGETGCMSIDVPLTEWTGSPES